MEPGPFRTDFLGRSISVDKKEMPEYAATAGVFRTYRANNDGRQVGDPSKAIKVMLKAINSDSRRYICRSARALIRWRAQNPEPARDIDASK